MVICGIMQLKAGFEAIYKKRHDELWSEMKQMLIDHSLIDYYIYWDEQSNQLFSFLKVNDLTLWNQVAQTPICQKWWSFMKDIMEVNPDNSPVFKELKLMFELHN